MCGGRVWWGWWNHAKFLSSNAVKLSCDATIALTLTLTLPPTHLGTCPRVKLSCDDSISSRSPPLAAPALPWLCPSPLPPPGSAARGAKLALDLTKLKSEDAWSVSVSGLAAAAGGEDTRARPKSLQEELKLDFIKEIGFTHMRILEGLDSLLQLSGLVAKLCVTAATKGNAKPPKK